MKKEKITALLLTAVMGLAAPISAQAAPSYQEAEKAALAKTLETLTSSYSQQYAAYPVQAGVSNISLQLQDAGKAFLGMMVPADISWLNDLTFSANVGFDDSQLAETVDVLLNGSKICTMEIYMDSETLDTYVRIPELADGYLKSTMEQIEAAEYNLDGLDSEYEEDAVDAASSLQAQIFLSDYMKALPRLNEYLPKPEDLNTVLDRYATIFIDHTQETESGTDTLTVEGISQECTTLDAILDEEGATAAANDVLTTARKDEELKAFIENLETLSPDSGISYNGFLEQIDSLMASLAEGSTDDGTYVSSKIWLDSEDQIVGRILSINNAEEEIPLITWMAPSSGDTSAYSFQLHADDEILELSGTGVTTGGKLNGTYEFSYNGIGMAAVDVMDYDTEAVKDGNFDGAYKLYFLPGMGEDEYAALGSFALEAKLSGDQTTSTFGLTLTSSDAPMVTLVCDGTSGTGSVDFVDLGSLDKVYDTSTDEGLTAFQTEMTLDTIMENLLAAGMPETFLEDIMSPGEAYDDTMDDYSEYDAG
ncbi:MAG: hypothetical protein Q4D55_09280 [Eubacteriales bacterium]|nr:hypothetical protein [Eubacteriales bacterium]